MGHITTPGRLDLRLIQQAFDNTRELIAQLRTDVTRLAAAAAGSQNASDIAQLKAKITQLNTQVQQLNAQVMAGGAGDLEVDSFTGISRAEFSALAKRVDSLEMEP